MRTLFRNLVLPLLAVLFVFGLSACATSGGVQVSQAAVSKFTIGQTTESQVLASLGQPSTVQTANGEHILVYAGIRSNTNAATFIPVVGLFAGGASVHTSTAVFRFRDGILVDMQSQQTNYGGGNDGVSTEPQVAVRKIE